MLRPKKNSYEESDNEKKFLRLENSLPSPPPISFLPSAFKLASHEEELEFRSSPRNKRLRGRLPSNSLKIYSSTVKNADCD